MTIHVTRISRYIGTKDEVAALNVINSYSGKVRDWLKSRGYELEEDERILKFDKKRSVGFWEGLLSIIGGDYAEDPLTGGVGVGYVSDFIERNGLGNSGKRVCMTDVPVLKSPQCTTVSHDFGDVKWLSVWYGRYPLDDDNVLTNLEYALEPKS